MKSPKILNLVLLPAVSAIFGNACSGPKSESVTPPNVIVIITDDQGWGDFSINGNKNLQTPRLDQIAEQGVYFTNFYVSPVSSPTRSEFLTGRYHARSGVYHTSGGGERINLDETTIADVFKKAGYSTAGFGKWHSGMQYPYHPNGRGFDEFYGFCSGHWGDYFSPPLEHNGKIVQGDGYIPDDITERSMAFIENNKDNPFFIYLAFNTPHAPMQVPDIWWDKFKDKEIEMLADERYKEDIDFTRAALAMCENIDWNVGRLLDHLQNLNLDENTIVVFFNDNGPNYYRWNGGMKSIKGSTDEGGVRSPLFVRWPGVITPGMRINTIAAAIDLLPTLADLAGIEYQTQNTLDGLSLKPLITDRDTEWNDRLIFSHWRGHTSVRSQKYRLSREGQLFDMTIDLGQHNDISMNEPNIASQLSQALEEWEADVLPGISSDDRKFPVGHPDYIYTQLPARDVVAHGGIARSNPSPNSTFFTNWTKLDDKITWDVEVMHADTFEVEIYYTCPAKDVGSEFLLSFGSSSISAKITEAHDPPLRGMELDRVKRINTYVKDFKPLNIGKIYLEKGTGELTLQALKIPGSQVMDFRLMMFTRGNGK